MRNITDTQRIQGIEHADLMFWLYQQLCEDDFLVGKTPEFDPEAWEDEES